MTAPRELSGAVLTALEKTIEQFDPGTDPSRLVDRWYRTADLVRYGDVTAAATYLGGYAARSILKYQEAVLALFCLKRSVPQNLCVIDVGAGPGIGFAALVDLLGLIGEVMGSRLSLEYLGLDRSASMLEVGDFMCRRIAEGSTTQASYRLQDSAEYKESSATLLIAGNVMNESEGNPECAAFLVPFISKAPNLEEIVVIEPATEQPSRQMCGLGMRLQPFDTIGPCPRMGNECDEWTYRSFVKRVYSFETRCLGKWAPAARDCKFSLAILSRDGAPRPLPADGRVVVSQYGRSGRGRTCRHADKNAAPLQSGACPWDVVDGAGSLKEWWP